MLVGTARGAPSGAIGEHARRGLEDVAVDAFDPLTFAARSESQEDFLGEILGVAKARRPPLKEAVQRAAIAHRQRLEKRLLVARTRGRRPLPPMPCHEPLPTRESERVAGGNQPCEKRLRER